MTTDKVRYFQGRRTNVVVAAADEEAALAFDFNPAMTEVQVVPLDADEDERIRAWGRIASHPIFKADYSTDGTLTNAMMARLDELHDAIVIRRGGAAVVPDGARYVQIEGEKYNSSGTPEWYEQMARGYALLAEYLREHPPVDEAQVKALAKALDAEFDGGNRIDTYDAIARDLLVKHGVRVGTP